MQSKTFRAATTKEALSRISRELGPDAIIMDQRKIRDHNGQLIVEVVAAPRDNSAFSPEATPTFWQFIFKNKAYVAGGIGGLVVITLLVAAAVTFWPRAEQIIPTKQEEVQTLVEETLPVAERKKIAVLPLENLGSPKDEYFADGITDEITARLARIEGLGVISRISAKQYKNTDKSIRTIGEELGVDFLLEGTIRWQKFTDGSSRVRITQQLIKIRDDTHLWAEVYERDLNDVFAIQASIAEQVASSLDVALLAGQREAMAARPTVNMEAYRYYLLGNTLLGRDHRRRTLSETIRMYEKAVELDPEFALAFAYLSTAYSRMYWLYYDRTNQRVMKAKEAVEQAFKLNPDLPEAYMALGLYYYHFHLNYDLAIKQFEKAMEVLGENSELLASIGYVKRRQGRMKEAVNYLTKAFKLDPRVPVFAHNLAETKLLLRNYPDTEHILDLAISLDPGNPELYAWKIFNALLWQGDTKRAYSLLEEATQMVRSREQVRFVRYDILLHMCDGNYQEALERLSTISYESLNEQQSFIPKALLMAQINQLMGRHDIARRDYENARRILGDRLAEVPEDHRLYSSLGIVYAGLEMKSEAIEEGQLGVKLMPVSKDAWRGIHRVEDLAQIYSMVGEYDKAIDQIEYLLSIPGELSIPLLRIDPKWDPLRNHPRFQKLLEEEKQYVGDQ